MAKYLKYIIENVDPIRIADDSRSQSGQTETLHYIAGSTIRGLVISSAAGDAEEFEKNKPLLFTSKIRFLNAYPTIRTGSEDAFDSFRDLMPVPKGFYANKGAEKVIQNVVVTGSVDSTMKRAGIGDFAYIDGRCLHGASIMTGSDLKIKKQLMKKDQEDRAVFRNQYIERGYTFAGYIIMEDDTYVDAIEKMFAINGVGGLYLNSITFQDYDFFMLLSGFYTLVSLTAGIIIDISYGFIDPRIRMGAK
jgi:hypothetical protein